MCLTKNSVFFSFPGEGDSPSVVIFNAFLRFRFQNFPTTSIGSLKACVDWFKIIVSMAGILTCSEQEPLITKPFLGKSAGKRCHKTLESIGAYQVDLPVQNIVIFSPLMVVYLIKALITRECKVKFLRRQLPLKKNLQRKHPRCFYFMLL